jgi:hypothetical protein
MIRHAHAGNCVSVLSLGIGMPLTFDVAAFLAYH